MINTNIGAVMARGYWARARDQTQASMERLSSGLRINSAADDAAGLAVSNKMLYSIKSYSVGIRNTHDMISLLKTADGALAEATNILMRIKELAVQSANGIYTNTDRDMMEIELIHLRNEIDRIGENTRFNDVKLFDGLFTDKIAQTGTNSGDHVIAGLDKFSSSNLGRVNVSDTYSNGDFDNGEITKIAEDVYALDGWEIHNKRVELGEDGLQGPATIFNRDGVEVPNLIGGWAIPEDPTPRPFNNAVDVFVAPSVSSTTSDGALTYNTDYTDIVDASPPDAANPGTWNITTGEMTSVSIVTGGTTNKTSLMGQTKTVQGTNAAGNLATFTVVIGPMTTTQQDGFTTTKTSMMDRSYPGVLGSETTPPNGDPALFNVTVGDMSVTQNTLTTTNLGMMGNVWRGVVGSLPDGSFGAGGAVFNVTIGEMSFSSITGATTTDDTSRMGITHEDVAGETPGHDPLDAATFDVTIGPMTVTPVSGTTTNNTSMMGRSYTGIAGEGPFGHAGSDAIFDITVGDMTTSQTSGFSTNDPSMMGKTYTAIAGTGPPGHGGDAATFDVTVGPMSVTLTSGNLTADGERFGRSYSEISALPPGAGGPNDAPAKFNVNIDNAGAVTVSIVEVGSGYVAGENITIKGSLIGGVDGGDDIVMSVNNATVTAVQNTAGTGYTAGQSITIPGTSIGGAGANDIQMRVGSANVSVTMTDPGTGYTTGQLITIPGELIGGANDGSDDVQVRVGDANITVTMTDSGRNYSTGDTITIAGEDIGGANDGSDDIFIEIGPAEIDVDLVPPPDGSGYDGYIAGQTITIQGEDIGGGPTDDVLVTVNSASVTATLATAKPGYIAPEIITISGTSINGNGDNDIQMRVNSASITVTLDTAAAGFKIGEEIRILGSEIGGVDGVDDIVVKGDPTELTAVATSGLGYTIGDQISLDGNLLAAGADDVVTVVELVPPGNDDSKRPRDYGDLESDSSTGGVVENGFLRLDNGELSAVNAYDIVHGPYLISAEAKYIEAGEKVFFDWKASGTNDGFDVFAYLLNVDTGETQILLDGTQNAEGVATDWETVQQVIESDGNYKFVFINGTYDATGGKRLGAEMFLDNIYIANEKLPALKQHTADEITVLTEKEAANAIDVMELSIFQISLERAKIGALINRLEKSLQMSGAIIDNLKRARSRVMDAEYTIETVKLAKQQILESAASQMLKHANVSKQTVMYLLE